MRKTPLKRGTKQLKRTPLKRKLKPRSSNGKTIKLSPRLGINLNAKYPSYKGYTAYRYNGIKGIAWVMCSTYVRKRDNYTCVTCGNSTKEAQQAGHYIPAGISSNNTLSFDDMNIHCQCRHCNEDLGGLQEFMGDYIERKYGKEVKDDLKNRAYKIDPITNWEDIIIYYEEKLKHL